MLTETDQIKALKVVVMEQFRQMARLLNKVNLVTSYHRGGNDIPKDFLDQLSNRQIEVEELFNMAKQIIEADWSDDKNAEKILSLI